VVGSVNPTQPSAARLLPVGLRTVLRHTRVLARYAARLRVGRLLLRGLPDSCSGLPLRFRGFAHAVLILYPVVPAFTVVPTTTPTTTLPIGYCYLYRALYCAWPYIVTHTPRCCCRLPHLYLVYATPTHSDIHLRLTHAPRLPRFPDPRIHNLHLYTLQHLLRNGCSPDIWLLLCRVLRGRGYTRLPRFFRYFTQFSCPVQRLTF